MRTDAAKELPQHPENPVQQPFFELFERRLRANKVSIFASLKYGLELGSSGVVNRLLEFAYALKPGFYRRLQSGNLAAGARAIGDAIQVVADIFIFDLKISGRGLHRPHIRNRG